MSKKVRRHSAFSDGDPVSFFINRFRGRRLDSDRVAINKALQIVYTLEFNLSTDKDDGILEVKNAEANEQHKLSIISALRIAAPLNVRI